MMHLRKISLGLLVIQLLVSTIPGEPINVPNQVGEPKQRHLVSMFTLIGKYAQSASDHLQQVSNISATVAAYLETIPEDEYSRQLSLIDGIPETLNNIWNTITPKPLKELTTLIFSWFSEVFKVTITLFKQISDVLSDTTERSIVEYNKNLYNTLSEFNAFSMNLVTDIYKLLMSHIY